MKEIKTVLIVGWGHIGQATVGHLKDCEIWYKDKGDEYWNFRTGEVSKEVKADYWVICVPGEKDGYIDTNLVDKYVELAKENGAEPIVRTTLPLDYEEDDSENDVITYWPSFVTDYDTDEQRIVMSSRGYENGFCKYVNDGIMFLSLHDTIITKLFSNAFLATRAEFFNKVADYSENAPAVINAICADRRIGDFYNYAERKRWGGKCFVKDMNELAKHDTLMKEVNESNKKRSEK